MKTEEHSANELVAVSQEGLISMKLVSYEDRGSTFLSNVRTHYVKTYGTTMLILKVVKIPYIL
jgi:hypothetical protein